MADEKPKQLLHLVFGGELSNIEKMEFRDLDELDIVGIFPELRVGAGSLEGEGADDGRQRPYALFHRPHAQAPRPGDRREARRLTWRRAAGLRS